MPSDYLKVLKNIIFPSLCLCCEIKIKQGHLCAGCEEKIIFLGPLLCRYCARPKGEAKISCQKCQNKIYPYDKLISATAYREPMVSLIHLFKYKNFNWLGQFFSSLMIKHLKNIDFSPWGYDFIIPVPMHKYKLKKRGYNQSKLLAKLLSNHFKIPLRDDIINTVNIRPSQAKLQKQKRQENVEGIFTAEKDLTNKKVMLIDDIFTTGSTAASCCRALLKQNVSSITVITLARS